MKEKNKRKTIYINDVSALSFLETKQNISYYVTDLIRQDMYMKEKLSEEDIIRAVREIVVDSLKNKK